MRLRIMILLTFCVLGSCNSNYETEIRPSKPLNTDTFIAMVTVSQSYSLRNVNAELMVLSKGKGVSDMMGTIQLEMSHIQDSDNSTIREGKFKIYNDQGHEIRGVYYGQGFLENNNDKIYQTWIIEEGTKIFKEANGTLDVYLKSKNDSDSEVSGSIRGKIDSPQR